CMTPNIFGLSLYMPSYLEPHYGRLDNHILRKFSMWEAKSPLIFPPNFSLACNIPPLSLHIMAPYFLGDSQISSNTNSLDFLNKYFLKHFVFNIFCFLI